MNTYKYIWKIGSQVIKSTRECANRKDLELRVKRLGGELIEVLEVHSAEPIRSEALPEEPPQPEIAIPKIQSHTAVLTSPEAQLPAPPEAPKKTRSRKRKIFRTWRKIKLRRRGGSRATVAARQFFSVSRGRLIALTFLTLGGYAFYWFYQNWKLIREYERGKVSPFWRAFFHMFYAYELFRIILLTARKNGYEREERPSVLAAMYLLAVITIRFSPPFCWLYFLALIPLMRVQNAIYFLNRVDGRQTWSQPFLSRDELVMLCLSLVAWAYLIFNFTVTGTSVS